MLNQERELLYRSLEERIGKTPLVKHSELPNGNRLWLKLECDSKVSGSHYDRVYSDLFRHLEDEGKISPGQNVFETTTGNAGIAFAAIGKLLDYTCHVAIPYGAEEARVRLLEQQGAIIYRTPEDTYVNGLRDFARDFMKQHRGYFMLNHSMSTYGKPNTTTLDALAMIAEETLVQGWWPEGMVPDFFIPAVGNGSSVLGPGRSFRSYLGNGIKVIAFEHFQSAVAYDMLYPGNYEQTFGIKPGTLPRHRLSGTSLQTGFEFPHIRAAIDERIIDDVVLVSDKEADNHYRQLTGKSTHNILPRWDDEIVADNDFGRSTRAGIGVALSLAEKVNNKNMLVIAYDRAERYDR